MECITIATDSRVMPAPNVIGALAEDDDVTAAPGWLLPPQRKRRPSPWEIERSDAELRLAAALRLAVATGEAVSARALRTLEGRLRPRAVCLDLGQEERQLRLALATQAVEVDVDRAPAVSRRADSGESHTATMHWQEGC
jgi:hypothetical protein